MKLTHGTAVFSFIAGRTGISKPMSSSSRTAASWGLPLMDPSVPGNDVGSILALAHPLALDDAQIRPAIRSVWPPTLKDAAWYGNDYDATSWAIAVSRLVDGDDDGFVHDAWTATDIDPPPLLVRAYLDDLRRRSATRRLNRCVVASVNPAVVPSLGNRIADDHQDRPRLLRIHRVWIATDRPAFWSIDADVCFHRSGAMQAWCARLVAEMGPSVLASRRLLFRTVQATALGVVDEQSLN